MHPPTPPVGEPLAADTRPCPDCGTPIPTASITVELVPGRPITMPAPDRCDACVEAEQAKRDTAANQRRQLAEWLACTPPLYQESDGARFPAWIRSALTHWLRDNRPTNGIGLVAPTGLCKTRAAFQALRVLAKRGYSVDACSHLELADLAIAAYAGSTKADRARALDRLRHAKRADYMILDDIGKAPMTDRSESVMVDLVETRTSHKRPIIWTSEAASRDLVAMMDANRGEAFVRRLAEFAPPILQPEPTLFHD